MKRFLHVVSYTTCDVVTSYLNTNKKAALGQLNLYANDFTYDALSTDSQKIERIEGNRPIRTGNADRIGQVFCLRHRGLDRVSAGCHDFAFLKNF